MPDFEQQPREAQSAHPVQRQEVPENELVDRPENISIRPGARPHSSGEVLRLQQMVGNRAVSRLVQEHARSGSIQAKLTVGPAADVYEQEADHVAAQVMSAPAPAQTTQRAAPEEEEVQTRRIAQREAPEEEEVQTKRLAQRGPLDEEEIQTKRLAQRGPLDEEEIQTRRLAQRGPLDEEEIQTRRLAQRGPLDEEEIQTKRIAQREAPEEEEVQTKRIAQRGPLDEEEIQTRRIAQREAPEEEEVQTKRIAQRGPLDEEEIQTRRVQRMEDDGFEASSDVEQRLDSQKGGGAPLPSETRSFMEPRFGADFSNVRVHSDSESAQLSRDINAQAFTQGGDIFMGAGKYNPGTTAGNELLAHELTHVVQQGAAQKKEEKE